MQKFKKFENCMKHRDLINLILWVNLKLHICQIIVITVVQFINDSQVLKRFTVINCYFLMNRIMHYILRNLVIIVSETKIYSEIATL